MTEFLFFIFIVSTFIHGFHAVTREGKLLSFLGARIKEDEDFHSLQAELNNDKLIYLGQFIDEMEVKLNHPQIKDSEIVSVTRSWIAAIKTREDLDIEYNRLQEIINKKKKSKKWKFILAIAPAWSECKECMSSLWSVFFILVFAFINLFGLHYSYLIVFAPFCLAGISSIFSNLSNNEGLTEVSRHLKDISDAQ